MVVFEKVKNMIVKSKKIGNKRLVLLQNDLLQRLFLIEEVWDGIENKFVFSEGLAKFATSDLGMSDALDAFAEWEVLLTENQGLPVKEQKTRIKNKLNN